jgi:copper chaperone CopZ
MSTLTREFAIDGMHCQGCVKSVTGALSNVPGVKRVDVSLGTNSATVEFDGTSASPATIAAAIESAGFEARVR